MNIWQRWLSTIMFFFGIGFMSYAAHEMFHLIAIVGLGGDAAGAIRVDSALGYNYPIAWLDKPIRHEWIVALSGGLGAALLLLLFFWIWAFFSETLHDLHIEVTTFTWAMIHLANIPLEFTLPYGGIWEGLSYLATIPVCLLIVLIYIRKTGTWLFFKNGKIK